MAIRTAAIVTGAQKSINVTWQGFLASADTGTPVAVGGATSITVQLLGIIGTGGAVTMEGSLDGGTTWATLEDINSADVALSALGIATIHEIPTLIRPNCTAGAGATDLDIKIHVVF